MEKNNKKRPRHHSSTDKIQEQKQSEKQQQDQRPKNKNTSSKNKTTQQAVDTELAHRFLPSKKRNQLNKDELTEIQSQLNDISQELERQMIRHFRLMKMQASGVKKKQPK